MTGDISLPQIEELARALLLKIGEDPEREGLRLTPQRVAEMLAELTSGYRTDPREIIDGALFAVEYDEMIVVKDIEFYSLCEHHLTPFFGKAHVGYIPDGKVIGFSKIPRIVDHFSRRLQLQERLTEEIANFLMEAVEPQGVGVVLEGFHLCMAMRGVKKQNARMVTSAMKGLFRRDPRTRAEFLELIGQGKG
ncbi:MAG: GTP cyclohydrolase I FolE [Candidatus Acetothermia bacterium]|jgi:GTP cyclohydrolase I|nr:GTP cyclohydrolase I FolE [Candidatus Acetothermia bacterium]MDH7504926.1 GTP cyclohydrolase I FolE [Candidatus Acetothermia bacterium]